LAAERDSIPYTSQKFYNFKRVAL